ncbi:MAG: BolA family transcriptional regulator [Nevskia sp.]|nr:BolA family transcriptional regulator [Nevskia sp.]
MRVEKIRQKLEAALKPLRLEVEDEGHKHVGHAHAGRGHYRVFIVCPEFSGKPLIARHRMVYEALGAQMREDIHALSIVARAPEEVPELGA